jgi:hypothetical protein
VLVVLPEDVLLDLHHPGLRQAGRVGVRGAGPEVHVVAMGDDSTMVMGVPDDSAVRHHVRVLVRMLVVGAVVVIVDVVVSAARTVLMVVIVPMIVGVNGAVGVPMLAARRFAFDLRFAAAAAACRAHDVLLGSPHAISISFTRISSP